MIQVALIDDDVTQIESLKKELGAFSQIQLVFTAQNGEECLEKLKNITDNQYPNVILMDIAMPKIDGIRTTQRITNEYPSTQTIIFTTFEDDEKIISCIKAGAKSYLLKSEPIQYVVQTIEEVLAGGSQMSPAIARKIFRLLQKPELPKAAPTPQQTMDTDTLTKREQEVLEHLRQGLTYKKIAQVLQIEENTVKKHIRNIYEKLGVNNQVSAIQKNL